MNPFPSLTNEERAALLEPPTGPVRMVLDTDTYNEIDDQFAVVYALLSPRLHVEAIYAAPFHNSRSTGPADGMEKSYEEILRLLDRLSVSPEGLVHRGATAYLPAPGQPVPSPAAEDLVSRALAAGEGPLYVVAIGCITNVASALLIAPEIARRIVVVWLGGQPPYWHTASEFNLMQDVPAAQTVFDSGVPLVHLPCKHCAEYLRTTLPEMAAYVRGQGAIGDYLYDIFEAYHDDHFGYSKVIWDISTIAYLNEPAWVPTRLEPSPLLRDDLTWGPTDASRHAIRLGWDLDRDAVFRELFLRLRERAQGT